MVQILLIHVSPGLILREGVQRITCPDVEIVAGNRRSGPTFFIQIAHGDDLPLRTRFEHRHLATRAYQKDLQCR